MCADKIDENFMPNAFEFSFRWLLLRNIHINKRISLPVPKIGVVTWSTILRFLFRETNGYFFYYWIVVHSWWRVSRLRADAASLRWTICSSCRLSCFLWRPTPGCRHTIGDTFQQRWEQQSSLWWQCRPPKGYRGHISGANPRRSITNWEESISCHRNKSNNTSNNIRRNRNSNSDCDWDCERDSGRQLFEWLGQGLG